MSSFFRSPNDVTDTQDQSDGSLDDTLERNSQDNTGEVPGMTWHKPKPVQRTPNSKAISSIPTEALTREATRELSDDNRNESSEWILRALLEEKCLNDALADYKEQGQLEVRFTKDHPKVRELADAKYKYMTEILCKLQVLAPERNDPSAQVFKEQTRQGLDMLTTQSPQPGKPVLVQREESFLRLNSGMLNLVLSASPNTKEILDRYRTAVVARAEPSIGLPTLLRPLVDHPMIETSRYRRSFSEIGLVGKGGYGRVYHVRNHLDGWNYAIKKINLSQNRLKRIQERGIIELELILKEIRMLAKFDHPNIVRYYGGWLEYTQPDIPHLLPLSQDDQLLLPAPKHIGSTVSGADLSEASIGSELSGHAVDDGLDIMFERSGGGIIGDLDELDEGDDLLAEMQPQFRNLKVRRESESTTGSTKSKKSSVYSVSGEERVINGDQDLQLLPSDTSDASLLLDLEEDEPRSEVRSILTLHIQMTLYPLSLADYLSIHTTSDAATSEDYSMRHCFHLRPSLQILLAILSGVEYLHSFGVVHRDLKPSNVFINVKASSTPGCVDISNCPNCYAACAIVKEGYLDIRIGDFGLVTEIAKGEFQNLITPNTVGTELYRPLHSAPHPNEKLDIFALGMIAAELLQPFTTRMERQSVLRQVRGGQLTGDAFPSHLHTPEISSKLAKLVREMTCTSEAVRLSCSQARKIVEDLLSTS